MQCKISIDINQGKHRGLLRNVGAKNIVSFSKVHTNLVNFKTETKLPSIDDIKKRLPVTSVFEKASSFYLSNSIIDNKNASKIGITEESTERFLKGIQVSSIEDINVVNDLFVKSNNLVSPSSSNLDRLVLEGGSNTNILNNNDRSFVKFTSIEARNLFNKARELVYRYDYETSQEYEAAVNEKQNDLIRLFTLSALYRGYNILIDGTMNASKVKEGISLYNKYFNPDKQKIVYGSMHRHDTTYTPGEPVILKFSDVNTFIKKVDNKLGKPNHKKTTAFTNVGLLTSFLTEKERTTYDKFKKASNRSKIYVVSKIASVFKKFIPNLDVDVLTENEINILYGRSFTNKKGFIIGNKIVINIENFDSSTIFHEFGHYYIKWLENFNPELHSKLMEKVKKESPEVIKTYTDIYKSTGINFSENDILEEVFVHTLGIKASEELLKKLPIDAIVDNRISEKGEILEISTPPTAVELKEIKKKKNLFSVEPAKQADKKAKVKASLANKYIGFGEGIEGSSTALYAEQAGEYANVGKYKEGDIIFVSIGGKRQAKDVSSILIKKGEDKTKFLSNVINKVNIITSRFVAEGKFSANNFIEHFEDDYDIKLNDNQKSALLYYYGKQLAEENSLKKYNEYISTLTFDEDGKSLQGLSKGQIFYYWKTRRDYGEKLVVNNNKNIDYLYTIDLTDNPAIATVDTKKAPKGDVRKQQQDKTIKEALKAIKAGAILLTDTIDSIHSGYNSTTKTKFRVPTNISVEDFANKYGLYNLGEKRLYENLKHAGYVYSEVTVDGEKVGVWTPVRKNKSNISQDSNIVKKTKVKGINISSKNEGLGKLLTNPGNNLGFIFEGIEYKNAEHAYQTWKTGEFNQAVYDKGKQMDGKDIFPTTFRGMSKVNEDVSYYLMVDILEAKFKAHPELIEKIRQQGGEDFLNASTHNITGKETFWETKGDNMFISALTEAYINVEPHLDNKINKNLKNPVVVTKLSWKDLKGKGLIVNGKLNTTRIQGTNEHFGNPFTGSAVPGAIYVGPYTELSREELKLSKNSIQHKANIRHAVYLYKNWILGKVDLKSYNLNEEQIAQLNERRKFIIDFIIKGNIPKKLAYFNSGIDYYSHADVLASIINTVRYNKIEEETDVKEGIFSYKGVDVPTRFPLGIEQVQALEGAIDHIDNLDGNTSYTIQGSAGTGKTTIISLLHSYLKRRHTREDIIYATPTHAANVQLAMSNLENGIVEYPSTIKRLISKERDSDIYTPTKLLIDSGSKLRTKILVIDEASMLDEEQVFFLKLYTGGFTAEEIKELTPEQIKLVENSYIDRPNYKIIYLGDPAQIPKPREANDKSALVLTSIFDSKNGVKLEEVYRQKPNTLLKVLNMVRDNTDMKFYKVENGDNSLQYKDNQKFFESLYTDFKESPEETIFIAYRNATVQKMNKELKMDLTNSEFIKEGDKLVGFIGQQSKNVDRNSIANSLHYIVNSIESYKGNSLFDENELKGTNIIQINSISDKLRYLRERGFSNIRDEVSTLVVPLSDTDSIRIKGITLDEYTANNKYIVSLVKDGFTKYRELKAQRNYTAANKALKSIRQVFTSIDLGADYIYDYENNVLVPANNANKSAFKKIYGRDLSIYTFKKGIDYGYSITAHKSQGMTIKNVYVDLLDIKEGNRGIEPPIYDRAGNKINTEKNALLYVAMSRASNKTILNTTGIKFDEIIDNKDLTINQSKEAILSTNIGKTIEAFTSKFVEALTGVAGLTAEQAGFNTDSTIADIFNTAIKHGTANNLILSDFNNEALSNLKDFFVNKLSPIEVYNSLVARGLIRRTKSNKLILLDESGNFVNEHGDFKKVKPITIPEDGNLDEVLEKIDGYLDKFKDLASAMFSVPLNPTTTEDIIKNISHGVKLAGEVDPSNPNSGEFYEKDGEKLKRVSSIISDHFGNTFNVKAYVKFKIFEERKKLIMDIGNPEMSEDELKLSAREQAFTYVEEEGSHYKEREAQLLDIFDFKAKEGTYLHSLSELFIRALNYSNKIEYNSDKKTLNYFLNSIIDNITNPDRVAFKKFFDDNFFSRLIGEESTDEYKAFKEIYSFIEDNMDSASAGYGLTYLNKLRDTLEKDVFKNLDGPITLMPEVKLASKALGTAGTVDLLVIDGNGVAHIFDYKTKEEGKRNNWDYKSSVYLKNELSSYSDNAMMKASIQTSIYKLILKEYGIQTAPAKVFYVESSIVHGQTKDALDSKKEMRYRTKEILTKSLVDVTSEITEYFKNQGAKSSTLELKKDYVDIADFTYKFSGNYNIDLGDDLTAQATKIYDNAIRVANKSDNEDFNRIMGMLGPSLSSKKGLVVRLKGNVKYTLDPKVSKREDAINEIKKLLEKRVHIKSYEAILESIFLTTDRKSDSVVRQGVSMDVDTSLRQLISGIDPSTHELIKVSSNMDYGLDHAGTVMFKNKITGEIRLVIINHDEKHSLGFGKGRTNAFGNYINDKVATIKYKKIKWGSNTHNMRLLRAGLMIIKSKQLDPNFKISQIVTNTSLVGRNLPRIVDVHTLLSATKAMIEVARDSGEEVPKSILDMLENERLFDPKEYIPNPIKALGEYLTANSVYSIDELELFKSDIARERRERLKELTYNFDPHQDYEPLLEALHEFRHSLEQRLASVEDRYNNELWKLTDHIILYLSSFNHTMSPKNTTFVDNFISVTSKAPNVYQATFSRKIQDSTRAIRKDFMNYKEEMSNLIDELAKSRGVNISMLGPALYSSSMKKVFSNLYEDDKGQRSLAFRLKKLNDPSLNKEERAFLKFFKETAQKFTNISTYGSKEIKEGWMPLMNKSRLSNRADIGAFEKARKTVENMRFGSGNFSDNNDLIAIDKEFSVSSKFADQIPNKSASEKDNYTLKRRQILGVDQYGNDRVGVDPNSLNKIEDNLENVLDNFVLAALDAHHYKDVTAFGRALFYNIKRHEGVSGLSFHNIIETITLIQKRVIKHEESSENNKFLNGFNKFATQAAIAGTISQALLETFTNPMVTSVQYLADKLYGDFFGGTREFNAESYAKAVKIIWSPTHKDKKLVEAINLEYGFTNIDTKELKAMLNKLEKHSIFQSKRLMYVNHLMMENWQKITMTAYMIQQGSFYAHSLDENGVLVYDETKDKRFNPDPDDTAESAKEKKAIKLATKEQLAKERYGLTGNSSIPFDERKMARALTNYDANHLKEIIVELYSSLDESSKSLATYYTWMGFISKMRTWLFAKIPRYFQKPMTAEENSSAARLVKEKDPTAPDGYRYVWKGEETEGIYYSIVSLIGMFSEYKFGAFNRKNFSDIQKKNFSKLLMDLLVSSVVSAAAYGIFAFALDDEDRKDENVQLVYNRILMATGDVFLLKSLIDMPSSSMFISVSIAFRLATSLYKSVHVGGQYLMGDEDVHYEDILESLNQVAKSAYGPYRTIETIYKTATKD